MLSRTPTLAEETYGELLKVAEAQGYDVSSLHRTEHTPDSGVISTEVPKTASDGGWWWLKGMLGK